MSGAPNAPPFPVPYAAHTDIQLRDLYRRLQRIERTVKIVEGEPVEVDFGTVNLLPIRPVRVVGVNVPYNRGWWGARHDPSFPIREGPDPILVARLGAPVVVLNITAMIKEQLIPYVNALRMSVMGLARGRDPIPTSGSIRPNFAVAAPAFQSQSSAPAFDYEMTGFSVNLTINNRADMNTGLPDAYQNVGRVLRTAVDLYVGMWTTTGNGGLPFEPDWPDNQKGSIDLVVTYIDSGLDVSRVETRSINDLAGKTLLIQGGSWGPTS